MTKHELSSFNQEVFDQSISSARTLISDLAVNTLTTYWKIGRIVHEIQSKYGGEVIKNFAEKLSQLVNKEYSTSTIYRMHQFFTKYTEDSLKTLLSKKVSWTQVVSTLSSDADVIAEVVAKVESGSLTPSEFGETVGEMSADGGSTKEDNKPSSKEKEPESELDDSGEVFTNAKALKKAIASVSEFLESGIEVMGTALLIADQYNKASAAEAKELKPEIKKMFIALNKLSDAGEPAYNKLIQIFPET